MKSYMDLTEQQQHNLFFFIDKAGGNHFTLLKEHYPDLTLGGSLKNKSDKVIHSLMMDEINFDFFITWLNHVHMHGNNTIYIFEPEVKKVFSKNPIQSFYQKIKKKTGHIVDTNIDSLNGIQITHSKLDLVKEQIIITLVAPSYLLLKDKDNNPYLEKDIYLAYLIIDYKLNHFRLSLHPTHNVQSINSMIKDKDKGFDNIALMFMDYFRKNFLAFNYTNPDWIFEVMAVIVEEYFDHNNPIIEKKLSHFTNSDLKGLVDTLTSKEDAFKKKSFVKRFERALLNCYETELIEVYKQIPKEKPFSIFLHEAGKGIVSFMANSQGKPLNYADSRNIVKMMMENTLVSSLGITYSENGKPYPYKVSKSYNFISLKRVKNSGTPKEIVDDVLFNLSKYKSIQEFGDTGATTESIK
ncbi:MULTISPECIES: hypothetical protein [unclassified Bacillus (in: firmicutes)]|uniref:hypothetical protein n=1 Tax=unclassified Bacillus (in: firmicutes) TaxID=185979 RepID=UPI00383318B3